MKKVVTAIIGNGNISPIYLKNLTTVFNDRVEVKGVCDLIPERSQKASGDWNVPVIYDTMYDVFKDSEIEIVLNLTRPGEHYGVAVEALKYGKNTHSEKPMSITRENAKELFDTAKEKGLLIGVAPDTFLGAGIQTCREILDSGEIGEPIGATAYMLCHGHESWHPDPEFYYEYGGGPMLDMGPYYVTALVNLLGPVDQLCGVTKKSFPTRTITSEKKYGKVIDVEVDTHVNGIMEFKNGAVGTITTSFDVWGSDHPCIEIYGTKGSMQVPDPNGFGGPVRIQKGKEPFVEVSVTKPYAENSRGIAVWDMASALREGTPLRASGSLGFHVLDIMLGFGESSAAGAHYKLVTTCERPAAL
ncbi:MAG: Gfo/Idh/MocA family oxidoreductase [Oscillospiraceae bacterium]|jgi:predicted dehydrogenase|nr:Gfo/Idh/MocA family oxidoreductase [Oscillospiraceae bacterium]